MAFEPSRSRTTSPPAAPTSGGTAFTSDHVVRFYETEARLVDAVTEFAAGGLAAAEPVVFLATPPRTDAFKAALSARGVDLAAGTAEGRLAFFDAYENLAAFMTGDMPDERLFQRTVGDLVERRLRDAGGSRLRVYGEMVDVLWAHGNHPAALRLEELWHDLAARHPFSLLCAYAMAHFYRESARGAAGDDYRRHARAVLFDEPSAAGRPADAEIARVLQAEIEHRRQLEAALRRALADRRRSEEALRDREQELSDFLENTVESLHWVDADGTILWANKAELELLGYAREEYVGRHISEFHADPSVITNILERLHRNEVIRDCEATLRHKDGSIRQVLISSNVLWKDGKFAHTRCVTRDVTDRRRVEQQRRRAERHLATQYAVARVMAEARNLSEATPRILQAVCETTGWKLGAMWQVDEAARVVRCIDVWHAPAVEFDRFAAATRQLALPQGVGLAGRVWSLARPVWVADVVTHRNFPRASAAARAGLHGAFAFPIRRHERVTGVAEFFSGEVRSPDEPLLQLFDVLGTQIGQFTETREADEMRARLAAIVEGSDDGIIGRTLEGVITSWNPAAERIFGYSAPEAVGQHVSLIIPPERRGEEEDVIERLRRGQNVQHLETERRTRGGALLSASLTISPIRDAHGGIIGASTIARDVTETRRAQLELQRSERAARFLADSSAALAKVTDYRSALQKLAELAVPLFADWCAVDVVKDDGALQRLAVTHVDPARVAMAYEIQRRWPPAADARYGSRNVLRTGRPELVAEISPRLLSDVAHDTEHREALEALGLRSYISVPIRSEQKTFGVITFVTAESGRSYDATDLQTAEDLAFRAGIAIENVVLYEALQRAVRSRDDFLSMVAHELRNPLNALQLQLVGLLRAAEERGGLLPAEWVCERISQATDDAERLVRLVHNLLDLSRITAGRLDLEPEDVDLRAVIHTVVNRFRHQTTPDQIRLHVVDVLGRWDRLRIDQILMNLLSNAVKYGAGRPIELTVDADGESAYLSVSDGGIGIDPAQQQRLFERFERGVTRRQYGGFGLGLWITRNIVEAMGGEIAVESRPGEGSTFRLRLPLRPYVRAGEAAKAGTGGDAGTMRGGTKPEARRT